MNIERKQTIQQMSDQISGFVAAQTGDGSVSGVRQWLQNIDETILARTYTGRDIERLNDVFSIIFNSYIPGIYS